MPNKVELDDILSGYGAVEALNANFDKIEVAFNKTLFRDGTTPNEMTADLNLNGFDIINIGADTLAALQGSAGTITIGTVTTLPSGSQATVQNVGTAGAAILNFGIPTGPQGPSSVPQPAYNFVINTLTPGSSATLDVTDTYPNQTLTFGIPRGDAGASGALTDGTYADITVSGVGTSLTVGNNKITFAKMQDIGVGVIGNTAGTADPSLLTFATVKSNLSLTKADVGLGSVDNTSDANKPVSTAQATAIAAKRLLAPTTQTGNFSLASGDTEMAYYYTGTGHTATINNLPAVGAIVTIANNGTGDLILSQSSTTLTHMGTGATGNITLPAKSMATLWKPVTGVWLVSVSR